MSDPTQPTDPTTGLTPPPATTPTPPPAPGAAPLPPYAAPVPPPAAPPAYQAPAYPPAAYGAPQGQPGYGAPAGYPAPGQPGYGAPYGYAAVRTNPLAVTSMVASIVGVLFWWTWVLALAIVAGIITGHIALNQIARTREKGRGMALAGVIIGWCGVGLGVLGAVAVGLFLAAVPGSTNFS